MRVPALYGFSDAAVSRTEGEQLEFLKMARRFGTQGIRAGTEQWAGEVVGVPSDHANYEKT